MPRAGRPPKPEDEQVTTVVRFANRHIKMLDRVIRDRARRDLRAIEETQPERVIPGTGGMTVSKSRIRGIDFALKRRELLSAFIEKLCTDDAVYPTKVKPEVPSGDYSDMDLAVISDWSEREGMRLTESAPIPIQIVLAHNELLRKRRDWKPEEYLKSLRAAIRTAPEESK